MSSEHHDYSEIYTPSREVSGQGWAESMSGSSSVRTGSGDSGLSGGSHCINQVPGMVPPPPPIHKYPSWEDRIYQVASQDVVLGAQIDCRNNNSLGSHQLVPGGYGADINVPVYATVKGVMPCLEIPALFSRSLYRERVRSEPCPSPATPPTPPTGRRSWVRLEVTRAP